MFEVIYYIMLITSLSIFFYGLWQKWKFINMGLKGEDRTSNSLQRIWFVVRDGLLLVRLYLRESKMGLSHFLFLWGVVVILVNILVFTISFAIPDLFRATYPWLKASMTAAGVMILLGLAIAAVNRYVLKPSRFAKKFEFAWDDNPVLVVFILAAVFGFLLKEFVRFSTLNSTALPYVLWFLHTALILGFIALIPYTKLLHIVAAPVNIFTRSERKPGVMREPLSEEYTGAVTPLDLTRRDLLASLACMRCGRCQDICPAANSGTTLNPMFLMQNIRRLEKVLLGKSKGNGNGSSGEESEQEVQNPEDVLLIETVLDEEAVWACTTCRACMEMCPVYVEQMEIIGEMRRGLIESGETPPDVRDFLQNIQKQKNPWGEGKFKRDQWIKKSEIEIPSVKENPEFEWLWFVGCAHSFDNRNIPVARKLARLLNDLEVNYAVLGREEGCCGNDVRRVGEEGLFQVLMEENMQTFEKYGVERLFATSPHCYNTFKNEYEGYEVKFILEILYDAIKSGKLELKHPVNKRVTFHDPCYLGRYNGIYDLPREILKAIPGVELVEMPRNREKSFCCGAGGGNLVREYPGEDRPNNIRAREAASTNAEILAVACPFCMIMLEDGVKTEKLDDRIQVLDVIELVYESVYGREEE
ncbi:MULTISPECIES: heterodisulfide reductase-related iron-sulfur binding cluster [unclassified Archaeoglobus]|jgi:Fe-S oxidoreductase/nitrate reductase gamma subunit|uniref:heterodisulfide reductase-related iron-sulfur binding cluster n=1 Tax=unclassified Archaeoglobus TaxID=2643606 RepID=UPI0025C3E45C|nr:MULTISPECIES: heterodisulfide reductase-related iron-sulfur binding cluster [unclassified Archaeoglobus]